MSGYFTRSESKPLGLSTEALSTSNGAPGNLQPANPRTTSSFSEDTKEPRRNPQEPRDMTVMDLSTPTITISVADLQAIPQRITDLKAAQRSSKRRRRSESEFDPKRELKRTNQSNKEFGTYLQSI